METHDLILTGAFLPFVAALIWMVKYVLTKNYQQNAEMRAATTQAAATAQANADKALENWAQQVGALTAVRDSIRDITESLARHDEKNGIAHKQAAEIQERTAKVQERVAEKLDTLCSK